MKKYFIIFLGLLSSLYFVKGFEENLPEDKKRETQLFKHLLRIRDLQDESSSGLDLKEEIKKFLESLDEKGLDLDYDFSIFLSPFSSRMSGAKLLHIALSIKEEAPLKKLLEEKATVDDFFLTSLVRGAQSIPKSLIIPSAQAKQENHKNHFLLTTQFLSLKQLEELLLKTIEIPYWEGFKILYRRIPINKDHWEYAKSVYKKALKTLEKVQCMHEEELYSQALYRRETPQMPRPIIQKKDADDVNNRWIIVAEKTPKIATRFAKNDIENIKKIGNIVKNYLGLFNERGGISKQGIRQVNDGIILLPSETVNNIGEHLIQ